MFRNAWVQIHWFVGITAGVVLAIVGLTGAILSFEDEIQAALNRDTRTVPLRAEAPLPPAALLAAFQQQNPDARVASLQLSSEPGSSVRVSLGQNRNRYVDPYTGNAVPGESTRARGFFQGTRSLHRWLVVGSIGNRDIGKHVVGASTLLCTLLALSGLYLRWPRRVSDWRAWLTFNPALKGRTFLWHLHAVLGTWVLAIFLVMSLTGPYWSYTWYRDGMYALAGAKPPPPRQNASPDRNAGRERKAAPTANLDAAWSSFQTATASTGGFRSATLNLPQAPGGNVEIRYIDRDPAHSRAQNTMQLDATTGALVRHERYDARRLGERLMSSVLALHSGSLFGLPGRILFLLASLSMPLFTITGWMMYLKRRRRARDFAAAAQVSAHIRSRL